MDPQAVDPEQQQEVLRRARAAVAARRTAPKMNSSTLIVIAVFGVMALGALKNALRHDRESEIAASPPASAAPQHLAPDTQPAATADSSPSNSPTTQRGSALTMDLCRSLSNTAKAMMTARQSGTPMADLMDAGVSDNPVVERVRRALVVGAFEQPHYQTPEMIERAIVDYQNEAFLVCAKQVPAP